MDQWYAVYRSDTGELVSTGTVLGDDLSMKNLIVLPINGDPMGMIWDENSKIFLDSQPSVLRQ